MSKFKSILIAFMCVIACFAFASCNWDVPSDGSTGDKTSISETTSDKESDSVKESTSENEQLAITSERYLRYVETGLLEYFHRSIYIIVPTKIIFFPSIIT